MFDSFVFGVIKNEIFHIKGLGQFAGIFGGGVMFLIRFETVCITVQTECFVEHPFAASGVSFFAWIIGFIAAAGQLFPISQIHREAKLFGFGRTDIEKCNVVSDDLPGFAVFHGDQVQAVAHVSSFFRLQDHTGDIVCHLQNLGVTVEIGLAFVGAAFHVLADHADHPDDTGQMVEVFVGDEDVTDLFPGDIGVF